MKITTQDMNNQNKKILLVITKSNFGGAQKYILELAKELQKRGLNVCVALGGNGVLINKLKQENIQVEQITYLGRDVSILNDLKTFFALLKIIFKYKPDVVHLNSSKIGGLGTLAARILFVPKIIFTIHGWAFNEDRSPFSKKIIGLLYFITIFLSHRSIAVSKETKKQGVQIPFYRIIKDKITIVRNGISSPDFLSKQEAQNFISEKIHLSLNNKIIIGQIAELHPIKSIETTIEAAKDLVKDYSDLVFILMGDGEQKGKLRFLIDKYNLNQNVFLLGFVDNAAQYLKAFDIFCLTSKSEALALVLLEAGFASVPIISSRVGGIPELITDNETGLLFESGNVEEFKNKVRQLLSTDEDARIAIVEKFYKKVQSKFTSEYMVTKTLKIYNI